eukprot:2385326-Prymnesium_polylepis.1
MRYSVSDVSPPLCILAVSGTPVCGPRWGPERNGRSGDNERVKCNNDLRFGTFSGTVIGSATHTPSLPASCARAIGPQRTATEGPIGSHRQ